MVGDERVGMKITFQCNYLFTLFENYKIKIIIGTGPTIFGSGPTYLVPSGSGSVVPSIYKPLDLAR